MRRSSSRVRRPRPPAAAAVALLVAAAALPGSPAVAAGGEDAGAEGGRLPCTALAHLAGFLAEAYGERPVSAGLQSNGQVLQIFSSPETGSWTAVTTSPMGLACVVATGRHWEQQRQPEQAAGGAVGGRAHLPAALPLPR
jgi:hypothetical protein